jgi:hypothetical protein
VTLKKSLIIASNSGTKSPTEAWVGGFSAYTVQPDFLKQADFCLFQKWAAAGRLQTGFLHLTYATSKPLIS